MKSYLPTQSGNKNILILKRKTNWSIVCFIGIWLIGWLGIVATFTFGLIEDAEKRDGEVFFNLIIIFLVGLWIVKTFLWLLRGKEQITIDENYFTIEKLGTIFTSSRKYEISLIDNFCLAKYQTSPWWYRLFGFGGGQITFDYLEQKKYFGQTLSSTEANEIIAQLKEHLNNVRTK